MADPSHKKLIKLKGSRDPQLLALCSSVSNQISVIELESKQEYLSFNGVTLKNLKKVDGNYPFDSILILKFFA